MKNFLSIGDVVKIKGVTHRMLRHYDEIGILPPAYISSDTGYRYYSKNQMIILDLIIVCVELGIPLKKIHTYKDSNGSYDAEKILIDGEKLARQKLAKLRKDMHLLTSAKNSLYDVEQSKKGVIQKNIGQRYFFTEKIETIGENIETYWKAKLKMYKKLKNSPIIPLYCQGTLMVCSDDGTALYSFVEVLEAYEGFENVLIVPSGTYECEYFEDDDYKFAMKKYYKEYKTGTFLIISDVIEKKIGNKIEPFEIQLLRG